MSESLHLDWPSGLSEALVTSLTTGDLQEFAHRIGGNGDACGLVIQQTKTDRSLRKLIIERWRMRRSELVAEAEFMPIDSSVDRCDWMIRKFGVTDVLLEMITDEEMGWGLAEWTVQNLERESDRIRFQRVFEMLSDDSPQFDRKEGRRRIVIIGGHVRDEEKMRRLVFSKAHFDVRWKLFEKKKGSGTPDDKTIIDAIAGSDAVLIVTSMISHVVMHIVKSVAKKERIPWLPIQKATELNLKSALMQLFPDHFESPNP